MEHSFCSYHKVGMTKIGQSANLAISMPLSLLTLLISPPKVICLHETLNFWLWLAIMPIEIDCLPIGTGKCPNLPLVLSREPSAHHSHGPPPRPLPGCRRLDEQPLPALFIGCRPPSPVRQASPVASLRLFGIGLSSRRIE